MKDEKEFWCKKFRMYEFLSKLGFRPKRIVSDVTNSKYVNWIYERTPELDEVVNWYFEKAKAKQYGEIEERMRKI